MKTNPYFCVGVGCGPSNLSVAALLHKKTDISSIFFDMKPSFSWHDGMMLPDASLQVSLFKDLVTLADPTNHFSFISYLHQQGRLHQFLNARFAQISRIEFADYMRWAAHTNENINFGERVLQVDFDGSHFVIETSQRRVLGENIVVGAGITPNVPEFARAHLDGETHFHIHEFAKRSRSFAGRRVVVVGGGQSGAEAVLELLRRTGEERPTELTWLSRRENFFPIDDSPFTNDFFTPSHSEYFFEQGREFREGFLERNVLASDGISEHTLLDLYQRIYTMRYIERSPMQVRLMPYRQVNEVWRADDMWHLAARHIGDKRTESLHADTIVWATGFRSVALPFMQKLSERLEREEEEFRIDRDYAAVWDGPADRQIFMLNAAKRQRGLADPNLSLTAWRSQVVIDRMLRRQPSARLLDDAFVNWPAMEAACPVPNFQQVG